MRHTYTGIDIGSHHVKVVIAAPPDSPDMPMRLLATGIAPARGMRHGYVVDPDEAAKGIKEAVARASQATGVPVKAARISLGGIGLEEVRATGECSLTPSGGIVTEREIDRALDESRKRSASKLANRTILHTIPLEYRIDGTRIEGRPNGMQGAKLAVDVLLFTILSQHHDDAVAAVEMAGVEAESVMAAPLAASVITLTRAQQTAGVVLADIGAETVSLLVFDNGVPVSLKVLSPGSADITNSIALSFQVSLSEAEQLKRGAVTGGDVPQKRVNTVVAGRLKNIFTLINAHLKAIGRQRMLPAGIVITGGGSNTADIIEIARASLKLPASIGTPPQSSRLTSLDAVWSVAYGLCRASFIEDRFTVAPSMSDMLRKSGDALKHLFRSLLP